MDQIENKIETEEIIPKKNPLLKKILLTLIILIILIFCYSRFWIHHMITIKEYPIIVESLPSNFNGLKIVHFSDIHFGKTTNEKELNKVVEEINLTNPDIVIFSGDLLDKDINLPDKNIDFLKETLAKIHARLKKYAIQGDSDYANIEQYKEIMTAAQFQILENQSELVFNEGITPIQIAGISSTQKETANLSEALKTTENNISYRILIAHEPEIIESLGEESVDLILCGHSLGGYIYIPGIGSIIQKEHTNNYLNGQYQNGSTTMFVSSGIGTEEYSFRFLNNPSINFYRFYNYN